MSFSGTVKAELAKVNCQTRHCQIAELAAMLCSCGRIEADAQGDYYLEIQTENPIIARKAFTTIKKTFNIYTDVSVRMHVKQQTSRVYLIRIINQNDVIRILKAMKYLNEKKEVLVEKGYVHPVIVQKACCKKAFIRTMFLSAGSISDPEKSYHFEIVCSDCEKAELIKDMINFFLLDAKIVKRKKYHVVYIKEGAQIVELLGLMGAHIALMDLENMRIVKEVRNSVNRRVNCETANIGKTVSAAVKQLEDIQYLIDIGEFKNLPIILRDIAQTRLEYPNASLLELGEMLTPVVGKSGVNHRLRKISEIASRCRGKKEE
ncbi:MAG: DNA-binding protein WhiA [Clostridia bacterium]|nr:DNA-binding protein WhiA [Clostridia bacterium]